MSDSQFAGARINSSAPGKDLDVLAIGHALVDVLTGVDDAFLQQEELVKGSMNLIDADRAEALYAHMRSQKTETPGGSAGNTATGVVACGGRAAFIGAVADDELGHTFASETQAVGVLYRTPPISVGVPTGRSMILITPDGERTMNTFLGAGARVGPKFLDPELVKAAHIVYVEGYMLDTEYNEKTLAELAELCHLHGGRFAITLSDLFCVERHRNLFLELLDSVDIVFGNEEEARVLFETSDTDEAIRELQKRCEVVAITRGAAGSTLVRGDQRVDIPAESAHVVDTTGAGDLYASGVLVGLARGWDLEEAGRLGSKAAAAVISHVGPRLTRDITLD